MMILVPVLHFSRPFNSSSSCFSVLNMEYWSMAFRLLSLADDTTRLCTIVKDTLIQNFIKKETNIIPPAAEEGQTQLPWMFGMNIVKVEGKPRIFLISFRKYTLCVLKRKANKVNNVCLSWEINGPVNTIKVMLLLSFPTHTFPGQS